MGIEAGLSRHARPFVLKDGYRTFHFTQPVADEKAVKNFNSERKLLTTAVEKVLIELEEIYLPEFTPANPSSCYSTLLGDIFSDAPSLFGQEPVGLESSESPIACEYTFPHVCLSGNYQGTRLPITFIIKTSDDEDWEHRSHDEIAIVVDVSKFMDKMMAESAFKTDHLEVEIATGGCLHVAHVPHKYWIEESLEAADNLRVRMEDSAKSWISRMNLHLETTSITIPKASVEQPELFGVETPEYGFIGEKSKLYGLNKYNKKFNVPDMPSYRDQDVTIDNAMIDTSSDHGMVLIGSFQGKDVTLPIVIDHVNVDPNIDATRSYLMVAFKDFEKKSPAAFKWGHNVKIHRFNEHRSFIYNQAKVKSEKNLELKVRSTTQKY